MALRVSREDDARHGRRHEDALQELAGVVELGDVAAVGLVVAPEREDLRGARGDST